MKARGDASGFHYNRLSYFLLQFFEQVGIEKLPQRYLQSVAKLVDRNNAGVLAFLIQDAVNSRRRHSRDIRKRIDCDIPIRAKLNYSFRYRFLCCYGRLLFTIYR